MRVPRKLVPHIPPFILIMTLFIKCHFSQIAMHFFLIFFILSALFSSSLEKADESADNAVEVS